MLLPVLAAAVLAAPAPRIPKIVAYSAQPCRYITEHAKDVARIYDGLFFVMRDGTSGDTTYRPSRFLYIDKKPKPNETFMLDFNKAYNPPCAFSEFTTCPLPPEQNILKTRIEAGEKYRKNG